VYHKAAAAFWKSLGFRFESTGMYKAWTRDTCLPLDGKVYGVEAWLTAARRKYKEFWPMWEASSQRRASVQ
jgi:hypothetical protein